VIRETKSKIDVVEVMAELLEGRSADRQKVTVVCDNPSTHTKGAFYEAFEPERAFSIASRIEFHDTPKHGSWLSIAGNELSSMTRQCVAKRRPGDIETLRRETAAWANDVSIRPETDWFDVQRLKLQLNQPILNRPSNKSGPFVAANVFG
jgi:hypothetical protein